jgi:hypothetical protein
MQSTLHRLSYLPRLQTHVTLFTRASCALCSQGRDVLAKAWERKPFEYNEIDVMVSGNRKWKDVYEFDVPVIHVARTIGKGKEQGGKGEVGETQRKLMHRFKVEEVVGVLEEVERRAGSS